MLTSLCVCVGDAHESVRLCWRCSPVCACVFEMLTSLCWRCSRVCACVLEMLTGLCWRCSRVCACVLEMLTSLCWRCSRVCACVCFENVKDDLRDVPRLLRKTVKKKGLPCLLLNKCLFSKYSANAHLINLTSLSSTDSNKI